eukprot:982729-Pleurochrysis_carterae.AAC.1
MSADVVPAIVQALEAAVIPSCGGKSVHGGRSALGGSKSTGGGGESDDCCAIRKRGDGSCETTRCSMENGDGGGK